MRPLPGLVSIYRSSIRPLQAPSRLITKSHPKCFTSHAQQPRLLQHHHLNDPESDSFTPYEDAERVQEQYRSGLLAWKGLPEEDRTEIECPRPRLVSFESTPTFTLGRRQEALTLEQTERLERPLHITLPHRNTPVETSLRPKVKKTSRGGLTTYHGPGQLVLWPILDMHSPRYPQYGVASYAAHLEAATQRLLANLFALETYTARDEPGVWVKGSAGAGAADGPPRKIAALGVHHRRHVTALGIALNVDVPVSGGEEVNPWARFVPCGLDGKLVTSVEAETGRSWTATMGSAGGLARDAGMRALAETWAEIFAEGLVDVSKRVDREAVSRQV